MDKPKPAPTMADSHNGVFGRVLPKSIDKSIDRFEHPSIWPNVLTHQDQLGMFHAGLQAFCDGVNEAKFPSVAIRCMAHALGGAWCKSVVQFFTGVRHN